MEEQEAEGCCLNKTCNSLPESKPPLRSRTHWLKGWPWVQEEHVCPTIVSIYCNDSPKGLIAIYSGDHILGKRKYPEDYWAQSLSWHSCLETQCIIITPELGWGLQKLCNKWILLKSGLEWIHCVHRPNSWSWSFSGLQICNWVCYLAVGAFPMLGPWTYWKCQVEDSKFPPSQDHRWKHP